MHFWTSTSTQMIDHEVGNLVSAIKQAQNSMEKQRKSGKNEMQLKTGRKAWKNSKTRFSQTVRKQFATIANFAMSWQPVSHCEIQ